MDKLPQGWINWTDTQRKQWLKAQALTSPMLRNLAAKYDPERLRKLESDETIFVLRHGHTGTL